MAESGHSDKPLIRKADGCKTCVSYLIHGTVLEEIYNSVDSKYLKCDFYNHGAEMQLGILKDGTWLKNTSFRIDLGEFGLDD